MCGRRNYHEYLRTCLQTDHYRLQRLRGPLPSTWKWRASFEHSLIQKLEAEDAMLARNVQERTHLPSTRFEQPNKSHPLVEHAIVSWRSPLTLP